MKIDNIQLSVIIHSQYSIVNVHFYKCWCRRIPTACLVLCTVIRIAYSPGLRAWHYLLVATASFVLEPQVMNLSHHYSKAPSVANLDTELERPLFLQLILVQIKSYMYCSFMTYHFQNEREREREREGGGGFYDFLMQMSCVFMNQM